MSLKQKFLALELPYGEHFDAQGRENAMNSRHEIDAMSADEGAFRNLIVTVEDTKIRHYKIDERDRLRDISSDNWSEAFSQVWTRTFAL